MHTFAHCLSEFKNLTKFYDNSWKKGWKYEMKTTRGSNMRPSSVTLTHRLSELHILAKFNENQGIFKE